MFVVLMSVWCGQKVQYLCCLVETRMNIKTVLPLSGISMLPFECLMVQPSSITLHVTASMSSAPDSNNLHSNINVLWYKLVLLLTMQPLQCRMVQLGSIAVHATTLMWFKLVPLLSMLLSHCFVVHPDSNALCPTAQMFCDTTQLSHFSWYRSDILWYNLVLVLFSLLFRCHLIQPGSIALCATASMSCGATPSSIAPITSAPVSYGSTRFAQI